MVGVMAEHFILSLIALRILHWMRLPRKDYRENR